MAKINRKAFDPARWGEEPRWFVVPASLEDAAELQRIHTISRYEADRQILPAYAEATLRSGYFQKYWEDALTRDDRFFLKAIDPMGNIQGFVAMGLPSDEPHYEALNDGCARMAELHQIYVAPECQHRHVGQSLYIAGARRLAEEGYSDVVINVLSENLNGKGFYEKMGANQACSHIEMIDRSGTIFPVPVDLYLHADLQRSFAPDLGSKPKTKDFT